MEFKSQICTSVEQSKRLLELGLKKETADCALLPLTDKVTSILVKPSTKDIKNTIPAWSLHRLLEMATIKRKVMLVRIGDDLFDTLIEKIRRLITDEAFNKDYLEERK